MGCRFKGWRCNKQKGNKNWRKEENLKQAQPNTHAQRTTCAKRASQHRRSARRQARRIATCTERASRTERTIQQKHTLSAQQALSTRCRAKRAYESPRPISAAINIESVQGGTYTSPQSTFLSILSPSFSLSLYIPYLLSILSFTPQL